jgi:hypothetical protein
MRSMREQPAVRGLAALVTVAALLAATSGCYVAFGTRPPATVSQAPGAPPPPCTRSRALPITDTIVAIEGALGVGLGGYGLLAIEADGSLSAGEAKSLSVLLLVTGAVLLVPWGLSARRGFRDVRRCRAL